MASINCALRNLPTERMGRAMRDPDRKDERAFRCRRFESTLLAS